VRKQSPKNVLMKDGKARRVPGDVADQLIQSGQAKHFISNTVYRALKHGIEVNDPKTRDEKGVLRAKVRDARDRSEKRRRKREEQERRKADQEVAKELHSSAHDD
jgi:hypothetical protein